MKHGCSLRSLKPEIGGNFDLFQWHTLRHVLLPQKMNKFVSSQSITNLYTHQLASLYQKTWLCLYATAKSHTISQKQVLDQNVYFTNNSSQSLQGFITFKSCYAEPITDIADQIPEQIQLKRIPRLLAVKFQSYKEFYRFNLIMIGSQNHSGLQKIYKSKYPRQR